jgi:hypothetical protein
MKTAEVLDFVLIYHHDVPGTAFGLGQRDQDCIAIYHERKHKPEEGEREKRLGNYLAIHDHDHDPVITFK